MGSENGCLPIDYCESSSFTGGTHAETRDSDFSSPPQNAIILIIIERLGGSQMVWMEFSQNGLDLLCKWYFCESNTPCFVGHTDIHRLWILKALVLQPSASPHDWASIYLTTIHPVECYSLTYHNLPRFLHSNMQPSWATSCFSCHVISVFTHLLFFMCALHLRDVSSPRSTAIGYESGTKLRLNVKQSENGKISWKGKLMGTNTALKLPSLWALQRPIISWQKLKEKGVMVFL